MTWTKLSDDFGDSCAGLSDAAFRSHVEALIWTMRREGGGYIASRDVKRFAESPHAEMAVAELVACGWWSIEGRQLNADRQKKHRLKKAGIRGVTA